MKKLTTAFLAIALVAVGTIFVFAQKPTAIKGNLVAASDIAADLKD